MSYTVIKEAPDVDFYVAWSNVMDGPAYGGTATEMTEFLYNASDLKRDRHPQRRTPEDQIARADKTGTSARFSYGGGPVQGSWNDPDLMVRDLPGGWSFVPRALIGELTRRWMANWDEPDLTGLDITIKKNGEDW